MQHQLFAVKERLDESAVNSGALLLVGSLRVLLLSLLPVLAVGSFLNSLPAQGKLFTLRSGSFLSRVPSYDDTTCLGFRLEMSWLRVRRFNNRVSFSLTDCSMERGVRLIRKQPLPPVSVSRRCSSAPESLVENALLNPSLRGERPG